jgi:hypothetical protein
MLHGRWSALVAAAILGAVMAVAPVATSQAMAYPVTGFRVAWGASFTAGSITWYNRNVNIRGSVKAVTGNKSVMFVGIGFTDEETCFPDPQTRSTREGTTRSFNFDMNCEIPGGFDEFYVTLSDDFGYLLTQLCTREGCEPPA